MNYISRSSLDSKDHGLEEKKVSPLKLLKTGFEALERGVEFWQLEAEGGGNDVDTKVGKFKIYWRMFDYIGAVMEKGLESGKEQILQDAECPAKYIDFNLWKMGTGLISDFIFTHYPNMY